MVWFGPCETAKLQSTFDKPLMHFRRERINPTRRAPKEIVFLRGTTLRLLHKDGAHKLLTMLIVSRLENNRTADQNL